MFNLLPLGTPSNQSSTVFGAQWGSRSLTFGPLAICSELSKPFASAACYRLYKWRSKSEGSLSLWGSREEVKRGAKEKQRKRESSKRVRGSPWALCSSCCSCCCSAVVFSHVSTAFYGSTFCCFIYELVKTTIMQKPAREWFIELG